jgi:hypothetical protein
VGRHWATTRPVSRRTYVATRRQARCRHGNHGNGHTYELKLQGIAFMEEGCPPSKRHCLSCEVQSLRGSLAGVAFHCWADYARERMEAIRYERIKSHDCWQASMDGHYWCGTCYDMGCGHGDCPYCLDDCHGI